MARVTRWDANDTHRLFANAAIAAGVIIGINSSSKAVAADADAPVEAIGITINAAAAANDPVTIAEKGEIEDASWNWTPGAKLWLSATAGVFTATKPTGVGTIIQPVGYAISATRVRFNINPSVVVLQAVADSTVNFQ